MNGFFHRGLKTYWGLVPLFAVAWLISFTHCLASNDEQASSPTRHEIWRVFTLRDYNTRVVVLGTGLLGFSAGAIGSFALLRRRALMGDALSHATLPGIGIAFLVATTLGFDGKSLPILLSGAAISGIIGTLAIIGINGLPRLKEDAALGIVLSVFFGAGISILVLIQQMSTGHAAGLESFIYGKTASMLSRDSWLIGGVGLSVSLIAAVLFKELKLLCFDETFAQSQGFSRWWLDVTLMSLIVAVTIIGLQAVGLILMIALLVIPAAAARFWTEKMKTMTWIAATIGAISAMFGSAASAVFPQLPSGATIVLVCSGCFLFSLFFGSARGTVFRVIRRFELQRRVGRQHLLRAIFEQLEVQKTKTNPGNVVSISVPFEKIVSMRSWSRLQLYREVSRAVESGEVISLPDKTLKLTSAGLATARRMAHEHRLWEMYLITHADIAPSKVDRDADMIEHVLDPNMIAALERLLVQKNLEQVVPSPHPLSDVGEKQLDSDERGHRPSEGAGT